MGIFNKLKFWKKEDIFAKEPKIEPKFEGGNLLGVNEEKGFEGLNDKEYSPLKDVYGPKRREGFESEYKSFGNDKRSNRDRDTELILSKLETIKVILDSLDHRMTIIEKRITEEGKRY